MYALTQENGHVVWREQWYTFTLRASLRANIYMIREDQVFVVDVVVTDLTQETVAMNVINQQIGAVVELSAIAKNHKYTWLHEGHLFILMVAKVHDT
jgi:hypothetical protein